MSRTTSDSLDGTVDDGPGDAELISAVRGGDVDAYGLLFARHVEAARRLGRQLVSGGDVDDLVSEAFAKVLTVLQRGGGPDLAFRAYLLTAVRRLHVDRIRAGSRLQTTDDLTPYDPGVPFTDTAVAGFENEAAARAFASLPERWQLVLWHTEVEGQKPAEIAPLLGMSANSVSALAYRAREGLRQAFVSMHAQEVEDDQCARTRANLGAYIRGGVSRRDGAKVEAHLKDCRACTAIYLELTEVNSNLGAVLAPIVLGTAAAAYVSGVSGVAGSVAGAAAGGGVVKGFVALLDRAKDAAAGNAATTAVVGVAATAVVAGGLVVGLQLAQGSDSGPDEPTAQRVVSPPADEGSPAVPDRPDQLQDRPERPGTAPDPVDRPDSPTDAPADDPGDPVDDPPSSPSDPPNRPDPTATGSPSDPPRPTPTQPVAPTPTPTEPTPSPTEPPPLTADLSVTSSASSALGLIWAVRADTAGLGPDQTATLSLVAHPATVTLTLDPRCTLISAGRAECRVTRPGETFVLLAVPLLSARTTLTFTIRPDSDVDDPDPGNDTSTTVVPR
ncbi:sigma-70 family RNA polymerase sigma factor [Nocardioides sp. SYSU D00038]|uniref:sigma-70 family RNA polymerase sigma factor n=1 Tax=Nocardioides sp. SYSU D00038 TaxID=2812554 RepID=UPI0019680C46|nr:sigma-70 family RNA polymerase sigma factor [Nocardioides sp. SYSU D00038]